MLWAATKPHACRRAEAGVLAVLMIEAEMAVGRGPDAEISLLHADLL